MERAAVEAFVKTVIHNMPEDWIKKTTHRLDVYNEAKAKTQFLEGLEALAAEGRADAEKLKELPTAYDYIRLGHPLSCLLEWTVAKLNGTESSDVISFSSGAMPLFAILRKNLQSRRNTRIVYQGERPAFLDVETLKTVYGYDFDLMQVSSADQIPQSEDVIVFVSENMDLSELNENVDLAVSLIPSLGSFVLVNGEKNRGFVSEIQHVRRRESIAMTPSNSLKLLEAVVKGETQSLKSEETDAKSRVLGTIKEITSSNVDAVLGSCGLSVQYAITMGLLHDALEKHPGKEIHIIVPPNCYGGTNDQARRVAACVENAEVVDLPVDSGSDMASSVETVLAESANKDAVPLIIAEIPTNPRVEVPDLENLRDALAKLRKTKEGATAVAPVFILDQTFCPNINFLGQDAILSAVQTISYVSGSKFPSGGLCIAGYCVANQKAAHFMPSIEKHIKLCDNEATPEQVEILAEQMPSMNQRIADAYKNTRAFVNFIKDKMPDSKINFVSEELAAEGFTPSVFSLDLPAKDEEHKRELNHKLIRMMIDEIPEESQHCVSYGQLKGCYWTVPATSTQGTTKEGDKDYIVRVSCSPDMDVERHCGVLVGLC